MNCRALALLSAAALCVWGVDGRTKVLFVGTDLLNVTELHSFYREEEASNASTAGSTLPDAYAAVAEAAGMPRPVVHVVALNSSLGDLQAAAVAAELLRGGGYSHVVLQDDPRVAMEHSEWGPDGGSRNASAARNASEHALARFYGPAAAAVGTQVVLLHAWAPYTPSVDLDLGPFPPNGLVCYTPLCESIPGSVTYSDLAADNNRKQLRDGYAVYRQILQDVTRTVVLTAPTEGAGPTYDAPYMCRVPRRVHQDRLLPHEMLRAAVTVFATLHREQVAGLTVPGASEHDVQEAVQAAVTYDVLGAYDGVYEEGIVRGGEMSIYGAAHSLAMDFSCFVGRAARALWNSCVSNGDGECCPTSWCRLTSGPLYIPLKVVHSDPPAFTLQDSSLLSGKANATGTQLLRCTDQEECTVERFMQRVRTPFSPPAVERPGPPGFTPPVPPTPVPGTAAPTPSDGDRTMGVAGVLGLLALCGVFAGASSLFAAQRSSAAALMSSGEPLAASSVEQGTPCPLE